MDRNLTICFTSDIHGYFSDMDYARGEPGTTGLSRCASTFPDDGNTLILDGGDTLQGSPLVYWLNQKPVEGAKVAAQAMSLAGYDFVTLGNHDFNYGKEALETYIQNLDARVISATRKAWPVWSGRLWSDCVMVCAWALQVSPRTLSISGKSRKTWKESPFMRPSPQRRLRWRN